jgi:hypothetical protein
VKVEQYLQHNLAVVIKEENYFNMNKIGTFFKRRNSLALLLLMFSFVQVTLAQNNSAIVEYASHDRGILIPRMSTNERTNIPFPAEGLIVYDNKLHSFFYFDGTQWRNNNGNIFTSGGQEFWPFTGIDNSYFGVSNPFLGTNDYTPLIFKTNDIERFRITPDGVWLFENDIMNASTNALFAKSLTVKNDVYLNNTGGSTQIDGATTIGGPLRNITAITGDLQLDRDLNVDGNTNIIKDLTVSGVALVNNFFTVTQGINARELTVQQDVILNSNTGTTLINGLSIFGGPLLNQATFKGPVVMEKSLTVKDLVVENTLTVGGPATFHNTILVKKDATLNAKLNVDGASDLNTTLNVDGATTLKNTLTVDGATDLNTTLNVDGASNLRNLLTVDGATDLNSTLNVDGTTQLNNNLNVTKNSSGFIANFSNTNTGNGDGINIQLGKAKSDYTLPAIPSFVSEQTMADMKKLIACDLNIDKLGLLTNIIINGAIDDIKIIAGLAVSVGNLIVEFINGTLGLPIPFGPIITPAIPFPAIRVSGFKVDVPVIPTFTLPGFTVTNGFEILGPIVLLKKFDIVPEIPKISLSAFGIPDINIKSLGFWGIPNLCLNDGSQSPLNNKNEFIRFSDKNNTKMGAIKAESVTNWADNYLNPGFLSGLYGAITSSKTDKFHAQYHFKTMVSAAVTSYAKIGVEYTSGYGDYAEWLEREDISEFISPGDIVGIKSGKVTRDLSNAEQVMGISHNPIVLGNTPPDGEMIKGNIVAFMGQIPVKVMGKVQTGDYIVGNQKTPGYGIAKKQDDLTIEDFKFAVGRAWESSDYEGPKMVNTVVGVHNGDYIKILKKYEQKFQENESRFDNLESKLNTLIDQLSN